MCFSKEKARKTNKQIIPFKMDRRSDFSKEDIQMANRYMKRCCTLVIIKEIKIKSTIRYHLIPVMAVTKETRNNMCW